MSCREMERLFVSGASSAEQEAHRKNCAECARLGSEADEALVLTAGLQAPTWSPNLRRALLEIPRQTVSCEGADALVANALEGDLLPEDAKRLESHLGRCAGCTAAAGALYAMRDLAAPEPPPWLATRLSAARPRREKKSFWRKALSGKMVIAYAYAAALVVMLLGLNPTAVARRAGFASLGVSTRSAVTVAQSSIGDRLGALQEKAVRTLVAWRGRLGGYGRAAVMNAIAIVWKPEPKKAPNRPHLGKEGSAGASSEEFQLVGDRGPELFPTRFRV